MTGAASATVAYTAEDDFGGGPPPDATWREPGIDVSIGDLSVDQALERSRYPHDPTPAGSRPGNWEGALSVSFTLTDAEWHDLVFADGGTALPTSFTAAPSAAWAFGVDLPDGTTEPRMPVGAIVTQATINYEQGNDITVELTILYADEPSDASLPAQADIESPSDDQAYSWHGTTISVDGLAQPLMQTADLTLGSLARFRRGQDQHPYDAVVDAIEPAFSTDAVFTERDQLAAAVDDSAGTSGPVGKVPAEFSLENGLGDTITYTLEECQPTTYNWSNLVAAEDLSEPIEYHVGNVTAEEVIA